MSRADAGGLRLGRGALGEARVLINDYSIVCYTASCYMIV